MSVALWAFGLSQTHITRLGPYGLPPALPVVFYAGVVLLVISASAELARRQPTPWRMALHATALVVMLFGTAPLVYAAGRYEWLYKTIGVVQYVNAHGALNPHIDIYQNWPGFFALSAWFDKVAGVPSVLAYGKWAQLAFELAAIPLLYLSYVGLGLSVRQRWLAIMLYSASNWVGQDYFSPQALGTVLVLGVMAITLRWLYAGSEWTLLPERAPGRLRRGPGQDPLATAPVRPADRSAPGAALIVVTLLLTFFVLTFTHELSPYILVAQLACLAIFRLVRPRWLPVAMIAIAIAFLIPRYSYVSSHYAVFSIGNLLHNAFPPSFSGGQAAPAQQFVQRASEGLAVLVWLLSAVGAWLHRRSKVLVLTLVLLAYSPAGMLAVSDYGHEGILRVYLFSLPWSAALAAMAVAPVTRAIRSGQTWAARLAMLRVPLALGVALALFFPAFFGDDSYNVMPQPEVATMTAFWQHAAPGLVWLPVDNAPVADTARYNLFPLSPVFGQGGLLGARPATPRVARLLAVTARARTRPGQTAYVLISSNMYAYNASDGITTPDSFATLVASLAHSINWTLIVHTRYVAIYRLTG
ncbi:MAG: hypothetical protein ACYCO9_06265 [Streptosporangiaceae bacterium]